MFILLRKKGRTSLRTTHKFISLALAISLSFYNFVELLKHAICIEDKILELLIIKSLWFIENRILLGNLRELFGRFDTAKNHNLN